MKYRVVHDIKDHNRLQNNISLKLWPEFMLHDPISNKYWSKLFQFFPKYQFSLINEEVIIGIGNCIPFYWDKSFSQLPEEGWDWVLEKGMRDYCKAIKPNVLNGLQIAVNKDYQGKGLSSCVLQEMKSLAKKNGMEYITIPVRPSLKSKYPLTQIEKYIKWKREDGLPFDPWLRVHIRQGGKIIKICHRAMHITGTVKEWEKWTNRKYSKSGDYPITGALIPIKINLQKDFGEYVEPNVWILHRV